jgi:phosphatidylglycerol:prolipoprotein diacylglycerol transferase
MNPTLFEIGSLKVPSYAFFVALAFVAALWIRHIEKRRLGWQEDRRQRWVGVGALVGAVIGSKVGMILFVPWTDYTEMWSKVFSLDFSGKTVVGGLIGGYIGVEITKKIVGIKHSTGDAFAVALPVAQGIGRIGCFFNGCCYGAAVQLNWSVNMHGASRHPAQLYEAALDFLLAALLFALRKKDWPRGTLFRLYLVGYAVIRFGVEFFRGDPAWLLGPFKAVQWVALAAILAFGMLIWSTRQKAPAR